MKDMIFDTGPELSQSQMACMAALSDQLTRLNEAVRSAVDSGLSIELQRSKRYHCGAGHWGDVMTPVLVKSRVDGCAPEG